MNEVTLRVDGMTCGGCVRSVKAIIARELGVEREQVEVSLERGEACVAAAPQVDMDGVIEALQAQGFPSRRG